MSDIPTAPPSGFRDFLPDACARRAEVVETIARVYASYGFCRISTPAAEDLAVLMGKGGGENERLIFKILKRGEKLDLSLGSSDLADMGLRFDLTLPLARFYSRHRGVLPSPFKAFNIGPVWRAERAQKGRYREFYQCDVDILGSESLHCEVEVISAVLSVFAALGLPQPMTVINDRGLLYALLDLAGVPAQMRGEVCILLDKLDKTERASVMAELDELLGKDAAGALASSLLAPEPDPEILARAAPEAAARLEAVLRYLRDLSGVPDAFKLLPVLVRGFDYYTGPVFEFRYPGLSGSLGGGGRYDGLTEKFGGQKTPACGVSIGFERLMLVLEEAQGRKPSGPDAVLTVFSEELRLETLRLAARLRDEGLSADVYPGAGKLKAQFKYADSRGARTALVLGPEESAIRKVKVKDLRTGEESFMDCAGLAAHLKDKAREG